MQKQNTLSVHGFRLSRCCALVVLTVWLVTGTSHASFIVSDTATMSDLIAGESLFTEGAEFSDWTVNNAVATGGSLVIDPDHVTVQAGVDGDRAGLQFLLGTAVGPGQTVDLDFTFKVSTEMPTISAAALLDGAAANGTGVVSIAETLFESFPGTPVGSLSVSTLDVESLADETALVPGLGMFIVRKDVVLTGGANGTASLSSFFQFFEQVPEPAAGWNLMIAVGMGLIGMRSRLAKGANS